MYMGVLPNFFLGGLSHFCSKIFLQHPKNKLPYTPHPTFQKFQKRILGTSSRWTKWSQFCRLINRKNLFSFFCCCFLPEKFSDCPQNMALPDWVGCCLPPCLICLWLCATNCFLDVCTSVLHLLCILQYSMIQQKCLVRHQVNSVASKPRGNDTFCVIGNIGGAERCCHEVRFETCTCVKIRWQPGPHCGSLQHSPRLPSRISGTGIGKEEWKGLGRKSEQRGKERKGEGEGNGI